MRWTSCPNYTHTNTHTHQTWRMLKTEGGCLVFRGFVWHFLKENSTKTTCFCHCYTELYFLITGIKIYIMLSSCLIRLVCFRLVWTCYKHQAGDSFSVSFRCLNILQRDPHPHVMPIFVVTIVKIDHTHKVQCVIVCLCWLSPTTKPTKWQIKSNVCVRIVWYL